MLDAARAFIERTTASRSAAPSIFRVRLSMVPLMVQASVAGVIQRRRAGWSEANACVATSRIAFRSSSLNLSDEASRSATSSGISDVAFCIACSASFIFVDRHGVKESRS